MLAAGTRLGPYEVLAAIGAGGMGEVYKARDTRLDRTVAIKILPSRLATNSTFRNRFVREARTLSSFAHPNICTLHDIGDVEGMNFIVMEYLEGETLADRLMHGAMSLSDILHIAIETAEGLASAHQRGIVHRDLKPANIMLTKSGAKLLDFGLARDVSTAVAVAGTSSVSATTVSPLTADDAIVGTFQYMSPEQIGGHEADHRSDVFAYGAVLYEMVTRRSAFGDRSQTEVIASILERAPVSVRALRPEAPCSVEAVINRCLEKDPAQRWQCMPDLVNELRRVAALSGERRRLALPPRRSFRLERTGWAAAVLLLLAVLVSLWLTKPPAARVHMHAAVLPPEYGGFALTGDQGGTVVASPDGQKLAFVGLNGAGESHLFVHDLASGTAREIAKNATFPFWSPDSRAVGFFAAYRLWRVEVAGGAPQPICEVISARGGTWGSSGIILFAPDWRGGLWRVSAAGRGKAEQVTKPDESDKSHQTTHRWPFFLPDGQHFLYSAADHDEPAAPSSIFFASLDGKVNKLVLSTVGNAVYAAGHLIYVNGKELFARAFDPVTGELPGEAETIAQDALYDMGIWRGIFSVSNNGLLVYQPGGLAGGKSRLCWFDRNGNPLGTLIEERVQLSVKISNVTGEVAVDDCTFGPNAKVPPGTDIWIVDSATGVPRPLTATADVSVPVWSRNGKWVAYSRTARSSGRQRGIYRTLANGSGGEEPLFAGGASTWVSDWTLNDEAIVFVQDSGLTNTRRDLWLLPLNGGAARPLLQTKADEYEAAISPDGRWIAYTSTSDEGNGSAVYVAPFPSMTPPLQVATAGGYSPRWNPNANGRELFFVGLDSWLYSAKLRPRADALERGGTTRLFPLYLKSIFQGVAYDVSGDGQRFLINTPAENPNRPLVLIQNWTADVKK